jgi:hypothetical protein
MKDLTHFLRGLLLCSFLCISLPAHAANNLQDFYGDIFAQVNQQNLLTLLRNMTGYNAVTVGGQTFKISERYSAAGKQKFRDYWSDYFRKLGYQVSELNYQTQNTQIENQGHNLEAILPGESRDSVVVIVHYDSMGPGGDETSNPAVDDDMTGMSISLETARILSEAVQSGKAKLKYTIRFVAADYEEWMGLEGARNYAQYIQSKAQAENFKIISSVDNEQSGWNCADDGTCSDPETIDIYSCSTNGEYDHKEFGDLMEQITKSYSSLIAKRGCMGEHSDNYAMWEIGVPSVVYSEHNPFDNPHFDTQGGDSFDKINQNYFFKIAQIGVTFAAELVGLTP